MTKSDIFRGNPNPHLMHDALELESPPPPDACDDETAKRNAELIVSQLMLGEAASRARKEPEPDVTRPPEPEPQATAPSEPEPEPQATAPSEPEESVEEVLRRTMREDLDLVANEGSTNNRARTRARYLVLLAGGGVLILWPTLVLGAILLLTWVALIVFWIMSHDVPAAFVKRRWQKLAVRRPKTAERLRAFADSVAMKLDIALGLLPDSWAESLAMPDLSQSIGSEEPMAHQDQKSAPF